ncbi:MAG: hypothetical protein V1792_10180 [Pseudomonadota bacterium]
MVSILLEKRLPISVPTEESLKDPVPADTSSVNPGRTQERLTVSSLLEDRLAAAVQKERPMGAWGAEDRPPRRGPRYKQHVGPLKEVNLQAGKVRNGSPGIEAKPVAEPNAPKLLKVIRRRGEQAPKVFEAASSRIPKSMLRGLKVNPEDDVESPMD